MKERNSKKRIITNIIACSIIGIILWFGADEYEGIKIKAKQAKAEKYDVQEVKKDLNEEKVIKENNIVEKEEIIKQYEGYEVAAKLEIPIIYLETYILQEYSQEALNTSVTKFWGVNANEIGNFCVAGHNFKNKNMFFNIKNLKIGDSLIISDNKYGKIEYKIYDLYKVEPDDVSCLSQETEGRREVTLITCTNDSEKRIIVKAREKNNEMDK